jgi:hypothetical protein
MIIVEGCHEFGRSKKLQKEKKIESIINAAAFHTFANSA